MRLSEEVKRVGERGGDRGGKPLSKEGEVQCRGRVAEEGCALGGLEPGTGALCDEVARAGWGISFGGGRRGWQCRRAWDGGVQRGGEGSVPGAGASLLSAWALGNRVLFAVSSACPSSTATATRPRVCLQASTQTRLRDLRENDQVTGQLL